jgi:hypothetical protein
LKILHKIFMKCNVLRHRRCGRDAGVIEAADRARDKNENSTIKKKLF